MLRWSYESERHRELGALPPAPLELGYGACPAGSPFRTGDFTATWRAIEAGYRVEPGDCPPVRLIARYGFVVRSPARFALARLDPPACDRDFADGAARFGMASITGDAWPGTDSGLVASWISGSEYAKVHTGIRVWFPEDHYLFQGPLPNRQLGGGELEVMAGLEFARRDRSREIDGVRHGDAELNVVCRLPPVGATVAVERGAPLVWLFAVPRAGALAMTELAPPRDGGGRYAI